MPEKAPSKFQVVIRASVDDVWEEITRTDAPILAFFNTRMEVRSFSPGSRLAMRSPDGKFTGVVGEILEFDPPKRFSHTFQFTSYDDPPCTVIYDLVPVDSGVQFTLTITDLPAGTQTAKQMTRGGAMIVKTLKSVLETGRPDFGTRLLYMFFKASAFMTPRSVEVRTGRCDCAHRKKEKFMARTILGVLVGYGIWTALWLGGNALLFGDATEVVQAGQTYDKTGPLVGILALSVVCSLAAGATCAFIARAAAGKAVLVMAVLLLVTGVFVQMGVWSLMPFWYHLVFLLLLVPVSVAAGRRVNRA